MWLGSVVVREIAETGDLGVWRQIVMNKSWAQLPATALPGINPGKVAHTCAQHLLNYECIMLYKFD